MQRWALQGLCLALPLATLLASSREEFLGLFLIYMGALLLGNTVGAAIHRRMEPPKE